MSSLLGHSLKHILSYVIPFPLQEEKSAINPYLGVYYKRGTVQLQTQNSLYSYGRFYTSFSVTVQHLQLHKRPIENVLMLGFGLGSLLKIFNQYDVRPHYTGVEIDSKVIQLARTYLSKQELAHVQLIQADAYQYIRQLVRNNQLFDLVAMDVFIDDTVPAKFQRPGFLRQLQHLLTGNGILLYNRFNDGVTQEYFKNTFSAILPHSRALTVNGNKMLIYDKSKTSVA